MNEKISVMMTLNAILSNWLCNNYENYSMQMLIYSNSSETVKKYIYLIRVYDRYAIKSLEQVISLISNPFRLDLKYWIGKQHINQTSQSLIQIYVLKIISTNHIDLPKSELQNNCCL